MNALKCEIVIVTPETARKLLEKNQKNFRRLNNNVVDQYAYDMKHGLWKQNGESIKIYEDGRLFDGQHRLAAIVRSGKTIPLLVVSNIPNDVALCDQGKTRSQASLVAASGVNVGARQTSTIGVVNRILSNTAGIHVRAPKQASVQYIIEHQEDLGALQKLVNRGADHPCSKKTVCHLAAYIHLRNGLSKDIISRFFTIVNSGYAEPFVECSPAITLRNAILNYERSYRTECTDKDLFATTYHCLDDFANQKPRRKAYKYTAADDDIIRRIRFIDGLEG